MYGRKKILVFTATYNEKENIELLVDKIIKTSPNVDILIIDDNSPDNTAEKVIQLKKKYNNITLITRDSKKGLDTAHKKAYSYAVNNRYDYLITMDADLSHDPVEINNILLNLDKFPFVIGSRYVENGKCLMHGRRLFLSQYGNKLIKFLLNINCNDYTTGYRGFDIASLNGFNLSLVENKGYSFFMGTVFEIDNRGFEVKEIPIIFKDRTKGVSKIPKVEMFRTLKNLFLLMLKKNSK